MSNTERAKSFVKIFTSMLHYGKMPLPKTAEMENKEKDFSTYTVFPQVLTWTIPHQAG